MKIVFMGTPDFAVPVLQRLIKEHEVVCVYTRAPKEAGRGKHVSKTPVHLVAEAHGIEVRTPKSLKDEEEQEKFCALAADVSVVAAYGLILPPAVIDAFPCGCLNVHASLLPRWRGAAPIQRCIEAGDKQSGVTIMKMVEALDAGDMLATKTVEITPEMTGGELHDLLAAAGAGLMSEVLAALPHITARPQDEKAVTYAAKLNKEECRLDFNLPAPVLARKVRAFNPLPAAYFAYGGERFKVLRAETTDEKGVPGEILNKCNELVIVCGEGALKILEIQRQGKKPMSIAEFLKGYAFSAGAMAG